MAEFSPDNAYNGFDFCVLAQLEGAGETDYFFFAKTSSTTAQMPAIVNGFEMTR